MRTIHMSKEELQQIFNRIPVNASNEERYDRLIAERKAFWINCMERFVNLGQVHRNTVDWEYGHLKDSIPLIDTQIDNERKFLKKPHTESDSKTKDSSEQKSKNSDPKNKEITFSELFKSNTDRIDRFFKLLKNPDIKALNEKNVWVYNSRKSSIVACFQALEDLDIIKKATYKTSLRRAIETKISFSGNEKLFRNHYNQDDYDEFLTLFRNQLS